MDLFRGILYTYTVSRVTYTDEYRACIFDSGNIVNISGNIFLYPPQGHPILYKYLFFMAWARVGPLPTKNNTIYSANGAYSIVIKNISNYIRLQFRDSTHTHIIT